VFALCLRKSKPVLMHIYFRVIRNNATSIDQAKVVVLTTRILASMDMVRAEVASLLKMVDVYEVRSNKLSFVLFLSIIISLFIVFSYSTSFFYFHHSLLTLVVLVEGRW
jgi:hypothetical protein